MTTNVNDDAEAIADEIRTFATDVDDPDNWMIIVPVDEYDDVKSLLDTTYDHGTDYQGIPLCYGEDHDETTVEYRAGIRSVNP